MNRVLTSSEIGTFQEYVYAFYAQHGRRLPWREDVRPYAVLVSEVMLQQTQANRVIPKFYEFLTRFPDLENLACAPQASVMQAWQGLGYNRRARFLHQAAQRICRQYDGLIPDTQDGLTQLPGVGPNTAGSIAAFAYNQPAVFIETNIRSVFLYWFFRGSEGISDADILPLVECTLPSSDPRRWYWALMDYGVYLKRTTGNPSRQSRHHAKQSPFASSKRKVRGEVIRLLAHSQHSYDQIAAYIRDSRLNSVLVDLEAEHLIVNKTGVYHLKE